MPVRVAFGRAKERMAMAAAIGSALRVSGRRFGAPARGRAGRRAGGMAAMGAEICVFSEGRKGAFSGCAPFGKREFYGAKGKIRRLFGKRHDA